MNLEGGELPKTDRQSQTYGNLLKIHQQFKTNQQHKIAKQSNELPSCL